MKLAEKSTSDVFREASVQSEEEVMETGNGLEKSGELYRELAELLGESAVHKLWKRYSGLSITFPQKLYSQKYTRRLIAENMLEKRATELAQMTNLSERRVRQIMKEIRDGREEN